MLYETHLLGAIVLGMYGIQNGYFETGSLFIIGILLGALLPDIDSSKSKLGRKIKPFSNILQWFAGHRGFMHSLAGFGITILIVGVVSLAFAKELFWPFFAGYGSHLVLDALTPEGIAPFYPLKIRFRGPIRTSSIWEKLFFVVLLIIGLRMFY